MVSGSAFVDEEQDTKFELASNHVRGWPRNFYVAGSGPKTDVALDILARTVDCALRRIMDIERIMKCCQGRFLPTI